MSQILHAIGEDQRHAATSLVRELLGSLVQKDQYVGEVVSLGYETAIVQIHDFNRQKVGGIPSLSFLVATRTNTTSDFNYTAEDSSVILLRVMDAAPLPNAAEADRVRVEAAQRVSGETDLHWDDQKMMDGTTHQILSFAGIKCRVIGTFFVDRIFGKGARLDLCFGSDISNYYPNRGLKVYKPNGPALKRIVNYQAPDRTDRRTNRSVVVGDIRYASTNRSFQGVNDVAVQLMPDDLLSQKTALFGMTRTGKSNTTKVILKSIFDLRYDTDEPLRIGQIVFDPNGEYANENVQDETEQKNPSAIKNVWSHPGGNKADVVTYGISPHDNDLDRKLMKLNFFEEANLQIGKEIIDAALTERNSIYINNFRQVAFELPDLDDHSAMTRYRRRVLVYRGLLVKAGFDVPTDLAPQTKGLFNADLRRFMTYIDGDSQKPLQKPEFVSAAAIFGNANATWPQIATALEHLAGFVSEGKTGYNAFEQEYVTKPGASGDNWADDDLKKLLVMFQYANGSRQIAKVRDQHTTSTTSDYAEDIYNDLIAGRLVIVDQSSGEPELNQSAAERIMWCIFRNNQEVFRNSKIPPDILIYIEEAHTLLPSDKETDTRDVWVRTAKEGAKYRIGMVYATQEVSSIQRNILKNTANWFIGHLNNTDETKEICKYYDFADFEQSIRRAQDRGFLRVKTLSNLFVIPIQVRKFVV